MGAKSGPREIRPVFRGRAAQPRALITDWFFDEGFRKWVLRIDGIAGLYSERAC
jgi:hypothetical protein